MAPVIDFHVHYPRFSDPPENYVQFLCSQMGGDPDEILAPYEDPRRFLQLMDENGIDDAVILAEYAPITCGTMRNEDVTSWCRTSDRLIPFASINPYLHQFPDQLLERLVKEEGFRGLKIYPPYQWLSPNDAMLYPLYHKAQELRIPIIFHTGSSVFAGARMKFGDPLLLDDVAVDFPDLTIVMAHGGRPFWYDRAQFLARLHRNVYLDVTGLPPQNLVKYFPEIDRIPEKITFGSDWPSVQTVKQNVDTIRSLPLKSRTIELLLGGNAARILGIEG